MSGDQYRGLWEEEKDKKENKQEIGTRICLTMAQKTKRT